MVMLTWLSALGEGSIAGHVGEVEVEPLLRNRVFNSCSSIVNCEMSTCRKVGLSLSIVVPWDNDSGRVIITGTKHVFSPSGYTTQASACKS